MNSVAFTTATLADACQLITDGSHFSPTPREEGHPIVNAKDIPKGRVELATCTRISENEWMLLKRQNCSPIPGDVLLSKDGTIGRVVHYKEDLRVVLLSSVAILRPKEFLNPAFLAHALRSHVFDQQLFRLQSGSALKRLVLGDIKKIRIPVPDSDVQNSIAEILSTLDEAIAQTEALIAKHQQIKAGLMHDLFTRGVTPDGHLRPTREQAPSLYKESSLGWIPKEWDACSIESLLDRIIDYRGKTPIKTIEGIPLITARNVRMGYIDPEPREFIAERDYPAWMTRGIPVNTDVVFTTEAPLGNVAQIGTSEKVAFAQRVIILQPGSRMCSGFLRLLLMAEPFQRSVLRLSSGTTALGVKQSEFRKVIVAYPVLREEQQFISERLQAFEAHESMEADRMQKLRQQKHGLMHDLLTGRVPVNINEVGVVQ